MVRYILLSLVLCSSGGCSLILAGTTQTIAIDSTPQGARCDVYRKEKIIGTVNETPGAVTIDKTKHDIKIVCKKEGYAEAGQHGDSGLESVVLGNIIFGGLIGWAVDSAAGADNKYPEAIHVTLKRGSIPTSGARRVPSLPRNEEEDADASVASRLRRLKKLRDDGLLTMQEYEAKRQEVLSSL